MLQTAQGKLRKNQVRVDRSANPRDKDKDDLSGRTSKLRISPSAKSITDSIASQTKELIRAQREQVRRQEDAAAKRMRDIIAARRSTKRETTAEEAVAGQPKGNSRPISIHHHHNYGYNGQRRQHYKPDLSHRPHSNSHGRRYRHNPYDEYGRPYNKNSLRSVFGDFKEGIEGLGVNLQPFREAQHLAHSIRKTLRPATALIGGTGRLAGKGLGAGYRKITGRKRKPTADDHGNVIDQAVYREYSEDSLQTNKAIAKSLHRLVEMFERGEAFVKIANTDDVGGSKKRGLLGRIKDFFTGGNSPTGEGGGGGGLINSLLNGLGIASVYKGGKNLLGRLLGRGAASAAGSAAETAGAGAAGAAASGGLLRFLATKVGLPAAMIAAMVGLVELGGKYVKQGAYRKGTGAWWLEQKGIIGPYNETREQRLKRLKEKGTTGERLWKSLKSGVTGGAGWLGNKASDLYSKLRGPTSPGAEVGSMVGPGRRPRLVRPAPPINPSRITGDQTKSDRGNVPSSMSKTPVSKEAAASKLTVAFDTNRAAIMAVVDKFSGPLLQMAAARGYDIAKITPIGMSGLAKVGQQFPKFVASKIPFLSIVVGMYMTAQRMKDIDLLSALGRFITALAGRWPGIGTAIATATSGAISAKDVFKPGSTSSATGPRSYINQQYRQRQNARASNQTRSGTPSLRDPKISQNPGPLLGDLFSSKTDTLIDQDSDKLNSLIEMRKARQQSNSDGSNNQSMITAIIKLAEAVVATTMKPTPPAPTPNLSRGSTVGNPTQSYAAGIN